jgi:hypothetical protein
MGIETTGQGITRLRSFMSRKVGESSLRPQQEGNETHSYSLSRCLRACPFGSLDALLKGR